MYTIVVRFEVPDDRREDFIDASLENSRNSGREEPGTLRFELIADEENPNSFYLNEAYTDAAAFQTHADGPNFKRFFERISPYAEGPTWLVKGNVVTEEQSRV